MKKRIIALMAALALSISLSACVQNKPISGNHPDEDKTEESGQSGQSEQEMKDSKTENKEELKGQPENGTTKQADSQLVTSDTLTSAICKLPKAEDSQPVASDTLTGPTEDAAKDNAVRDGEIDPDNPPVNWGTPDGPEIAVKDYYANTVFELVSFEVAEASREHVVFTIVSNKGGILVEPNRTIELNYEDGKWKVVNEGY